MASLLERWPTLSVPHLDLGARPLRVVPGNFDGRSIDVLDERESGELYGGNKVRKLEYLLADAKRQEATALIATGAAGSHHVLATALYGSKVGLPTHAVLIPQPDQPHVRSQLAAISKHCASVTPTQGTGGAAAAVAGLWAKLRWKEQPYLVPVGGSNAAGNAGWLSVGLDLADAMNAALLPRYRSIYVAVGSAGTAAGLLAGLRLGGSSTEIVGVRVVEPWFASERRILRMARASLQWLETHGAAFEHPVLDGLRMNHDWYAGGYGKIDDRITQTIQTGLAAGWALDPTYTSKALGACLEEYHGEPVLYVHTVDGHADQYDPIPDRLMGLLK